MPLLRWNTTPPRTPIYLKCSHCCCLLTRPLPGSPWLCGLVLHTYLNNTTCLAREKKSLPATVLCSEATHGQGHSRPHQQYPLSSSSDSIPTAATSTGAAATPTTAATSGPLGGLFIAVGHSDDRRSATTAAGAMAWSCSKPTMYCYQQQQQQQQ